MAFSSIVNGRVNSGADDVVVLPRIPLARTPLVYCHSASASPIEAVDSTVNPAIRDMVFSPIKYGFSVVAGNTGHSFGTAGTDSGYNFSNRIQDAIDYHRSNLGGTPDPVALFGVSMGCADSLIYALENPSEVSCIIGVIPAIDLVDIYQNDVDDLRQYVEIGWEITHPTSLPSIADLVSRANELSVPARFYYSNDDAVTSSAAVTAYSNAGAEMIDLGSLGHTNAAIDAVPKDDLCEFIQDNVDS